ncbi:TIGR03943 family putative permease subunit [Prauserella muralis]|uniref:TIGR03943 family protein n=1 Tax=Prauserella muralis TaxID=588067 RepID=A0A2V4BDE0_9PSEU|nr:TIGR03943 family protein [Prauserella muralis]PXY27649.1 TIGR03943 family protein [Prauserella muralis]TWE22616.1 putative repeat protein (TIGR03943 family) [Prauserella muralis]
MRRETQNILLVLLGGALLKIAITGDYLRYVKPSQQPWIIGGGAVMVLLGVVAIGRDVLAGRHKGSGGPDHEHDHSTRSTWLLLVPVLAVFLVAPPALGSDSVTRTSASAPAGYAPSGQATFPPLPAGQVVPLAVADFVSRAGWDSTDSLRGRTVSLTGFVVHSRGRTLLARMVIGCCAADAFPVRVQLIGGQADPLPDDTWVRVTGQWVPGKGRSEFSYTPQLDVATLREIPQPRDPYEY